MTDVLGMHERYYRLSINYSSAGFQLTKKGSQRSEDAQLLITVKLVHMTFNMYLTVSTSFFVQMIHLNMHFDINVNSL